MTIELGPAGAIAILLVVGLIALPIPAEFARAYVFTRRSASTQEELGSGLAVQGVGRLDEGKVQTADPLVVVVKGDSVLFRHYGPFGHGSLIVERARPHAFARRSFGLRAAVVELESGARIYASSRKVDRIMRELLALNYNVVD